MLVRLDRDGRLKDAEGFLVNGIQVHRGTGRMCQVVSTVRFLDGIPQRRHRAGANVLWHKGMAMVPLGEKVSEPRNQPRPAARRGDRRRARSRPAPRRRGSRRFTASSPPGGDDGSGDPEPSGLALPQTRRQNPIGRALASEREHSATAGGAGARGPSPERRLP